MPSSSSAPLLLSALLFGRARAEEVTISTLLRVPSVGPTPGLCIFGTYPGASAATQATTILRRAIPVTISDDCSRLSRTDVADKTLVVLNGNACRGHGPQALLTVLSNAQPGQIRAVVGTDDPNGDSLPPNYAILSQTESPSFLRNRYGRGGTTSSAIYSVSLQWADQLSDELDRTLGGMLDLNVSTFYQNISEAGHSVNGSVAIGHMDYFLYSHPSGLSEPLTITVTPLYGNPDLYVRVGVSPLLPTLGGGGGAAQYQQTSPGDDSLTVPLDGSSSSVAIGVYGRLASAFSLVVSAPSTEVTLTSGLPRRFETPGGTLYFAVPVARGQTLTVSLTTLTATPADVYISATTARPTVTSHDVALPASESFQHVTLPPSPTCLAGSSRVCTVHITVAASTSTVFSIAATIGSDPTRLVDGLPQMGAIDASGGEMHYVVRAASGHSDLTISLAPTGAGCGAHVYVSTPGGEATWSGEIPGSVEERVTISQADLATYCLFCDYRVRVAAAGRCLFTVTSSSNHAVTVLENGVPAADRVNHGASEYFKLYVMRPLADVEIVLSASTGDPDLFVSTSVHRPNATANDFFSSSHVSGGEVIRIPHTDDHLARCTAQPGPCILYIAVYGHTGDSRFSLSASAHDVGDGFRIEAPAEIAMAYPFIASAFGPRLPVDGINACVKYAVPHDACRAVSSTDMSGSIALVDRGSSVARGQPGAFCDYPDVLFANKVVRAQQAGAIAVIVVNNAQGGGMVNMVATSNDLSSLVTVPSIFTTYEVGARIKANLNSTCVRALLQPPSGRLPMLVDGVPVHGLLSDPQTSGNAIAYYQLLSPPGHDNISLTLHAEFGNPDVFVSTDGRPPNQQQYTWAARDVGSDTLVIDGHDPRACSLCYYYVAVIATAGDVGFTLTARVNEALRTLQASVPLGEQDVSADGFVYYRFFVDRNLYGISLSATPTTGAVELYASFAIEHPSPTAGDHSFSSGCADGTPLCIPSLSRGVALHIAHDDPHFCARLPCLLYVAAKGVVDSSFTILATIDYEEAMAVPLADGEVQVISLPHAGSYARFTFYADPTVDSFVVDVVGLAGDPDLYIAANASQGDQWPSTTSYDLTANTLAGETIVIRPGVSAHGRACAGCEYRLSVYAWTANTDFVISVTTALGVRLLSDALPAADSARQGGPLKFFRYLVRTSTPIDIVLTPLSGNPSLYARFGCRPMADCNATSAAGGLLPPPGSGTGGGGSVEDVTWASTRADGIEQLHMAPGTRGFCLPPCTLYVAVRAESDSTFSLLVTQREPSLVTLVDGQPQLGIVGANELKYYIVRIEMTRGLLVTLTSYSGEPTLYYSNSTDRLPSPSTNADAVCTPSSPLRLPPLSNFSSTYIFAVGGGRAPTNFSLLATAGGSAAMLVDGVPLNAEVAAGDVALYRINVPADAISPTVYLTALQGSVRVLMSIDGSEPTERSHSFAAMAAVHQPMALPLTPGSLNLLSIAQYTTSSRSRASFSLVAMLHATEQLRLFDGLPQALVLTGGTSPSRLVFFAQPHQTVSLTASTVTDYGAADADSAPLLSIYASTVDLTCAGGAAGTLPPHCFGATSTQPGEAARLTLRAQELSCGTQCQVHVFLSSTLDADVTITASTSSAVVQLQVGVPGCTAVSEGQLAQYAVLLDPDEEEDDRLTLQLHMCSGFAEMWAATASAPTLEQRFHEYASRSPLLSPIELPASRLAGRSRVFAAVHGLPFSSSSTFCLESRPSGDLPRETTLSAERGALELADPSKYGLAVVFEPLRDTEVLLQSAAAAGSSATAVGGMVEYQVWVAQVSDSGRIPALVFDTWCGISSSGLLLHNASSAKLLPSPLSADPAASPAASADESAGNVADVQPADAQPGDEAPSEAAGSSMMLNVPSFAERDATCAPDCAWSACLKECPGVNVGQEYSLTVVAIVRHPSWPLRRFIYQPVSWTPGGADVAAAGLSGGVVFLIVLLVLGCCAGGIGGYVYRSKLSKLTRRAQTRLRNPLSRQSAPRAIRGIGSETMEAPLTLNSYQHPAPLPELTTAPLSVVGSPQPAESPAAAYGTVPSTPSAALNTPAAPSTDGSWSTPLSTSSTRGASDAAYNSRLARARSARSATRSEVIHAAPAALDVMSVEMESCSSTTAEAAPSRPRAADEMERLENAPDHGGGERV